MINLQRLVFAFVLVLLPPAISFAADDDKLDPKIVAQPEVEVDFDQLFGKQRITACEMDLKSGKTTLISSGRDEDTLPKYIEYVHSLTKKGGMMHKLGMELPPHVFLFIPGQLAGVLSAMNMVPMGHHHDGARVAQGQSVASGILELVFPGGQHSFYRDDMNAYQQLSIINHAYLGHAWFAVHSKYSAVRTAEAISDSYKLYEMMERAYLEHDPVEVAEWYSFLLALEWDQDTIKGVEESPEMFRKFTDANRLKENKQRLFQVPRTRNTMAYLISDLPNDLPKWKLDMARQFERLRRYIPGAINTKNMNEGWSVLMQEIGQAHADVGRDFPHHMEYCCLLKGIGTASGNLGRDLTNPYYIGYEAWKIVRENFHVRPDMFNKTLIEKDKAFIAWATKELINKMDDRDFFAYALSDKWILRKNLTLTRNLGLWDPLERPVNGDPNQFKPPGKVENVSKDPAQIRRALIRHKEDSLLQIPTAAVRPMRERGGVFELEMIDGLGKFQPLKTRSMVAKLWTMSRMLQKPVAMESTYITKKVETVWEGGWDYWLGQWVDRLYQRRTEAPEFLRIHTTVYPEGRVETRKVYRNKITGPASVEDPDKYNIAPPAARQFEAFPDATERFQGFLDEFLVDWHADYDLDEAIARVPRLGQNDLLKFWTTTSSMGDGNITSSDNISTEVFDHSPTVPRALHEYHKKVSSRLAPALKKALFGRGRPTVRNGNLRIRVLPEIPAFQYNTTLDGKKLWKNPSSFSPKGPMDWLAKQPMIATQDVRGPLINDLMQAGKVPSAVFEEVNRTLSESHISPANFISLLQRISPPKKAITTAAADGTLDDEELDIDGNPSPEGDINWGPGKPPQGEGKPDQDGEPAEPRPGEDPADGHGGDPNDPDFVDIPPGIWGRILSEEIELPNTRPLDDDDNRRTKVLGKKARRKAGTARPELISREAFKLGISDLQNESEFDHPDDMLDALTEDPQGTHARGFRLLREQDWWVKGTRYKPNPDIKAVMYIVVDLSGSMSQWFNTVKKMSVDLRALLQAKYPSVEIRYVPFDGDAHVLENVDDLLRIQLAGGTSYGKAFGATHKHMDANFPYSEWDRYVVVQGDLIDFPSEPDLDNFKKMHERAQYTGVLHTGGWDFGGEESYSGMFQQKKIDDPFFGYEKIASPGDYAPIIYRDLFKNPPKEQ